MKAVGTTFLVDYLTEDDEGPVAEFLETTEDEPLYAPTLVLNEVYRGAVFADGAETVDDLARRLEWLERLPFTDASAREAVAVERELKADGEQINRLDVLIAGVVREVGAELVTRDEGFRAVDALEVVEYAD
ncbi:VapC toxin family PIN domain ribonuclease [Halobacteriales archaeon QS_4_69_225]|nr:MAG: VapC toxin family PIN domain ribonuclease [Halobacteriales archaeon QS_4_69_225]